MMAVSFTRFKLHNISLQIVNASRFASTVTELDPEWASAKPYSQIPGPKPLPIPKFGNFWRFLPGIGTYSNIDVTNLSQILYKEFGPIYNLNGLGRYDIIFIFDAEEIEKVYRNEGPWPIRRGVESVDYYRRYVRPDVFKEFMGVATSQGQEWQTNRTIVNQPMLRPQNIKNYHEPIQQITADFIERMRMLKDKNQEMPSDFLNELNKWSLEAVSFIALDTRLGCLDPNLKKDSDAQRMVDGAHALFEFMFKLDILPSLWRIYSTRTWKDFVKCMDDLTEILQRHINKKMEEVLSRPEDKQTGGSILEILLRGEKGKHAAVTMAMEMMMAGIDTTSNTTAIAMYHLATNPKEQERLHQALKKIMPNKNDHLPKTFDQTVPFLIACIKESQRLAPIAPANVRETVKDMVLLGYQIPKGTNVAFPHLEMSRMEKFFPQADKFIPDRWLKTPDGGQPAAKATHPFVYMPFGFGPRMCIGKRLAQLEIYSLIATVIRNFRISFNHGDLKLRTGIVLKPTAPLRFKIEERAD